MLLAGVSTDRHWASQKRVVAGKANRWVGLASCSSSEGKERKERRGEVRERERERKERVFDFFEFRVFETRIYSILGL